MKKTDYQSQRFERVVARTRSRAEAEFGPTITWKDVRDKFGPRSWNPDTDPPKDDDW